MRSLATKLPVLEASAAAEIVFHSEASAADWAESAVQNPKLSGHSLQSSIPPHWEAGIRYACTVSLAFLVVAAEETDNPTLFEYFAQHCVANVAGTTYQQKLQPYDLVPAKERPEILARFQRRVHSAAARTLANLNLGIWKRQSDRLAELRRSSQEPPSSMTAADFGCRPLDPPRETGEPLSAQLAPEREARLQAFLREHDVSIAAICRAANVHKADMQRWRHGKLSQRSMMSQRVEKVLSGTTPLAPPARKKS
jgi:hypothetical protein